MVEWQERREKGPGEKSEKIDHTPPGTDRGAGPMRGTRVDREGSTKSSLALLMIPDSHRGDQKSHTGGETSGEEAPLVTEKETLTPVDTERSGTAGPDLPTTNTQMTTLVTDDREGMPGVAVDQAAGTPRKTADTAQPITRPTTIIVENTIVHLPVEDVQMTPNVTGWTPDRRITELSVKAQCPSVTYPPSLPPAAPCQTTPVSACLSNSCS